MGKVFYDNGWSLSEDSFFSVNNGCYMINAIIFSTKLLIQRDRTWCYKTMTDHLIKSLVPSDVIWRHRSWTTLAQHYNNFIMGTMASQITSLTIVYSTIYSGSDHQRKHQSSASLAYMWGIHQWPLNSPHKWPVTRKMFPFDDVIMSNGLLLDGNPLPILMFAYHQRRSVPFTWE